MENLFKIKNKIYLNNQDLVDSIDFVEEYIEFLNIIKDEKYDGTGVAERNTDPKTDMGEDYNASRNKIDNTSINKINDAIHKIDSLLINLNAIKSDLNRNEKELYSKDIKFKINEKLY